MTPFRFAQGTTPLLISVPHCGTFVPDDIAARLTDPARALPDTDWHVERLYEFARGLGANMLIATHSRYVIDLNRPPDGAALYPGASNTELCPLTMFDDQPIYRPGGEPDAAEMRARLETYWQPYHETLRGVLERLRRQYGIAVLFDAHSIASVLPRFFDGRLTDLNLGTADGSAAAGTLAQRLAAIAAAVPRYDWVLDGRFKGGYITRHYGRPADHIHAVQLELSWATYLEPQAPYRLRPELAKPLADDVLRPMIETILAWAANPVGG